MKDQIDDLKQHIEQVKMDFVQYIKDKNIPLDDRWATFIQSPDCLSKNNDWIQHFRIDGFDEDKFYENHNRNETIYAQSMVESIEENFDYEECDDDDLIGLDEADPEDAKEIAEIKEKYKKTGERIVVELKEHFLSKNLKAFQFDW